MKSTHKVMVLVVLLVIVFSLVGCGGDPKDVGDIVNAQTELFVDDMGTAYDDSGLDTVAGEIDNLLVGGITGIDYTK